MVTQSGPASPEPTGASTHPNGFVGWLEEHVLPGMKEAAADANKARKVLPLISALLPKIAALSEKDADLAAKVGPIAAEAEQILAVIEAL
jgi:hypothetical protein